MVLCDNKFLTSYRLHLISELNYVHAEQFITWNLSDRQFTVATAAKCFNSGLYEVHFSLLE